jgi:hypothetical protein
MREYAFYLGFYAICIALAAAAFQLMTVPGEASAVALGSLLVVYGLYDAFRNRSKNN